jgi:hypothetical protein
MIQSRFYRVNGTKWEARFFHKGEMFPDTDTKVPRQGVWARAVSDGWDRACFAGNSWRSVTMDTDLSVFPERK